MKLQKRQISINEQVPTILVTEITGLKDKQFFMPSDILKFRDVKLGLLAFFMLAFGPVTSRAADTIKGGELYAVHCASCHGPSGMSVMLGAPNFARGESLMQPDPLLLISIKNGKGAMPAYQGILNDQNILDVIVYLRTLN